MKRQHTHARIPSNLNTHTHNYEKRYTLKEVDARIHWNSLKWIAICILVGWGAFKMGHITGSNSIKMTPPIANSSISQ
jgi:hypothetical protein